VDAKEVAFKAFKVSYDRDSGYVGYKVSGQEFSVECTKFDKLILVFKDGHYQVSELPEKLFVGPELFYCGLPERDRIFTCAYTNREATYLKALQIRRDDHEKIYHCIPLKSRILFFEPDTPAELYIKYKPAAYQKITPANLQPGRNRNQRTQDPRRQISIKDVGSINSKPPAGGSEAATTKLQFT